MNSDKLLRIVSSFTTSRDYDGSLTVTLKELTTIESVRNMLKDDLEVAQNQKC